ncbi:MAG: SUMF1/EgtB/PvdO family nonheme iron enzyme [Anaerolineae bacterium]|nr:SUMF1/EgtB/PvdO family nonheme iron enzyme [Anaerolineae bacterium]
MSIPLPDPAQISQLAQDVTTILSPYLPNLLAAGGEVAKGAAGKVGETIVEQIWNKLRPKVEKKEAARDAVADVVNTPDDPEAQIVLKKQIEKILIQDEALSAELRPLVIAYNKTVTANIAITDDAKVDVGNDMTGRDKTTASSEHGAAGTFNAPVNFNYYGEKPAPAVANPKPVKTRSLTTEQARAEYLNAVIADCRNARLVGLDPKAGDPNRGVLSLERLYVELDTKTQVEDKTQPDKGTGAQAALLERERKVPLSALQALQNAQYGRMVLLGLPGAGKSTFARYLALRMAQHALDPDTPLESLLPAWTASPLMPFVIPLNRFGDSLAPDTIQGSAQQIEDFMVQSLELDSRTSDFAPYALETLRAGSALVLFDGLDEVADLGRRPLVTQAIDAFTHKYGRHPNNYFLTTCRTFSYTDARWKLGWEQHELAPLTPDKIKSFVHAWYEQHSALEPARRDDFRAKRDKLTKALRQGDRRRLWEIADNPLMLTIMAVVHTHDDDLPDTRAQVYQRCVDLLLLRWELERSIAGRVRKRTLLEELNIERPKLDDALFEIAYKAHTGRGTNEGRQSARVTEDLLSGILFARLRDSAQVKTFLDYCESANGLLMLQGEEIPPDSPPETLPRRFYSFPHTTFEEYLAARYIEGPNLGPRLRKLLDENYDRWTQVAMLLGEYLCFARSDQERMDAILGALVPQERPTQEKDWRALLMAGDLLILYDRRWPNSCVNRKQIRDRLAELVETDQLSAIERVAAADTLGELGDPRPGIHVPPLLSEQEPNAGASILQHLLWCQIPAGPFWMGSSKNAKDKHYDPEAYADEVGQTEKYKKIDKPFYISRYPITNAQFDVFLGAADGFRKSKWWEGLAKTDNTEPPPKYGGVFDLSTHPVINITWYQAVAFSRWLNQFLPGGDLQIWTRDGIKSVQAQILFSDSKSPVLRLPTEAEWEKAARGPNGRKYPWDGGITPEHANYSDTGIGATSAVGSFPRGASEYGVLDASGNVWEWTLTKWTSDYADYVHQEDYGLESESRRVVRGGAFDNDSRVVRCAFRGLGYPVNRLRSRGFRVVVAPV